MIVRETRIFLLLTIKIPFSALFDAPTPLWNLFFDTAVG